MKDINSSGSKCRDVIERLCGSNLHDIPAAAAEVQQTFETYWTAEIDTAIDGYDVYCDLLSNASTGRADGAAIGVQDWEWGLIL